MIDGYALKVLVKNNRNFAELGGYFFISMINKRTRTKKINVICSIVSPPEIYSEGKPSAENQRA